MTDGCVTGRKRKPRTDEKREREIKPTPEALQRRTEALAQCIRLYPYPMARTLCERQDAGWYIGRLYLIGMIDEQQRSAAVEWKKTCDEFARLLGGPKAPVALDMERRDHTFQGTFETKEQEARFKRIRNRYLRGWDRLAGIGAGAVRAVAQGLRDIPPNVDHLRQGLRALGRK